MNIAKKFFVLTAIITVVLSFSLIFISCDNSSTENSQESLYFTQVEGGYAVSGFNSTATVFTIPESYNNQPVVAIADNAFYNAKNMLSLSIPEGITSIGTRAFYGCSSLESINIPASGQSIGTSLFDFCKNLKTVTVSEGNKNYKSVNNTIIDNNGVVVAGCSASVLPADGSIKEIGESAFRDCFLSRTVQGDKEVDNVFVVPDGVTKIGKYAFLCNTALDELCLPATITEIGAFALQGCVSLDTIRFEGTKAQWDSIVKGENYNLDVWSCKVICSDQEFTL